MLMKYTVKWTPNVAENIPSIIHEDPKESMDLQSEG